MQNRRIVLAVVGAFFAVGLLIVLMAPDQDPADPSSGADPDAATAWEEELAERRAALERTAPIAARAPEKDTPPARTRDTGAWRVSQSTNPLDDSTTVAAVLAASQGTGGFGSDPFTLVARCQSNTTEVYINWHDYLGDDDSDVYSERKRVTYRFPPADAQTEMWAVSTDNDATFAPRAIPFLRRAVEADQLVVRTVPYNEPPSTGIFDLAGTREALQPLTETCNWSF